MSRTTAATGIRIAVVTGAAVLCAGAAVPALAHGTDTGASPEHDQQLSFTEQKQRALRLLAHESEWLTGLKNKVAADDRLTADQRAAFTAKLDKALARVRAARNAVEAAGTQAGLRAALAEAELPFLAYPKHTLPSLADVKAAADRFLAARQARLAQLRAGTVAGNRLPADQKAAFLARIDAALADIAKAQDAVQAAATRAAVRAALASVDAWPRRYPRHRADSDPAKETQNDDVQLTSAKITAPAHRTVTVHRGARAGWNRDDPRLHRADRRCADGWGSRGDRRDGDRQSGSQRRERAGSFGGSSAGWRG